MDRLFKSKGFYIGIAIVLIAITVFSVVRVLTHKPPVWVTDTVSRGEVLNLVSVSGVVKAENTADLSFPTAGIVSNISVTEGDIVTQGRVLATLEQTELQADRQDAESALKIAKANRDELLTGPSTEARDVTNLNVQIAKDNLARVQSEGNQKRENARRTLLSDGLEALPQDKNRSDTPPTISGTFTCPTEGTYTLSVFNSGAQSGYSYKLSGLESGTFTAFTESSSPLGTCGLSIQFASNSTYSSQNWTVTVPNTRSSVYATNLNAYELIVQQETNNIEAATQALEKALREQKLQNATPRSEAHSRADATVGQAEARLLAIDARIADKILKAPFDGTISSIDIVKGETVTTAPVITVIANHAFKLTVRIPEIDITKVKIGQTANVVFDARSSEILSATVTFISPLATMIDGVAYFEANLTLMSEPEWLRGGLNADVSIIVDSKENVLRIPKRFLVQDGNNTYSVRIPEGETTTPQTVGLGFIGNDGYVEITGLNEGETIVAP